MWRFTAKAGMPFLPGISIDPAKRTTQAIKKK
jgi:hypothetical protein